MSVEAEMAAAFRAGQQAARDHTGNHNPYSGTGDTARERVLSVMWRKGYRSVVDERLPRNFPRN